MYRIGKRKTTEKKKYHNNFHISWNPLGGDIRTEIDSYNYYSQGKCPRYGLNKPRRRLEQCLF
jgi:hypothetical protein